ncbi:MAG: CapA family protein [Clostridia bacterium]|nr:CapA family protein [Clostridia bacterium]
MQQRPNPGPRRPMTRREYEMLQRQRRRQNIIALGILAAIAVVIIVAVVLILSPSKPARDKAVQPVNVASVPVEDGAASSGGTSVDLSDPRDGSAAAATEAANVDPTPVPSPTPVPTPRSGNLRSARIRVVGDVMVCESQLKAYKSTGYDFHPEFAEISDVLSNADYTIANMEGTVGKYNKSSYSGYPQFNCPQTILEALKDSGVDFLTLANNHMLDRFFDGLKNTVGWVQQYGLDYVGAYRTQEERNTPTIYEVNGIRIGFVAYTHSTNSIERLAKGLDPGATAYGVPYIQKADIEGDIRRLREAGAEVVIALPHWGEEYVKEPSGSQVKYAKRLAMAGADIIIGSHSHIVQPMGYKDFVDASGNPRRVFLMFSMGNFLSDHYKIQSTDCGMVLDFTINENSDGTFSCDNVGYIPTYCWQPTEGDVRILPSGKYLSGGPVGMSAAAHDRLVASFYEITAVLGDQFQVLDS